MEIAAASRSFESLNLSAETLSSLDAKGYRQPTDVQAETILSMSQIPGENTGAFRDSPWTKALVEELRRAQAEAEVRCF